MNIIKKLLPLAIFIIGFIVLINSPLGNYLSFDALQEHRQALLEFRDGNYLLAVLIFMGLYIVCVAFSVLLSGLFYYMAPLWLILLMLIWGFGMLCQKLVQSLFTYADNL